jgi:hypothetical protein
MSMAQTVLMLAVSLKVFGLSAIWYYILIPVILIFAIFVGYFDTKLGIREEEARNNNSQNPEIKEILRILKK